jgi:hypothetical protein
MYDARCASLRLRRQFKNRLAKPVEHVYVFVLCAPYCASTLMHQLLCTSRCVSPNNIYGTRGGFALPEVRHLVDFSQPRNESYPLPWADIKEVWLRYWDQSKPLLLDKSPPLLFQGAEAIEHFRPARLIAMVRNPYVHCEALMRRDGLPAREAAERSVHSLLYQKRNLRGLADILLIRYEDLVDDPADTRERLLAFLPALQSLDIDRKFTSHYRRSSFTITDMNVGKIERIAAPDLRAISAVLAPHAELLEFFGYDLHTLG